LAGGGKWVSPYFLLLTGFESECVVSVWRERRGFSLTVRFTT